MWYVNGQKWSQWLQWLIHPFNHFNHLTILAISLYHDLIIDHYQYPRNFGELKNPDATAREANASCGDMVEFRIKVTSDKLQVTSIAWRGVGCAISAAAASLLSERGKQIRQIRLIRQISQKDMIDLLGGDISHARIKCATLPLVALQKAIGKLETNKLTNSQTNK